MPGHTRAQCTLGKMSWSQLPSQRHMHSALNRHPHYCIRTIAGIHAAVGCSGLGVMYRFSNKNSSPSAMTSKLPHCRGHPPAWVGGGGYGYGMAMDWDPSAVVRLYKTRTTDREVRCFHAPLTQIPSEPQHLPLHLLSLMTSRDPDDCSLGASIAAPNCVSSSTGAVDHLLSIGAALAG